MLIGNCNPMVCPHLGLQSRDRTESFRAGKKGGSSVVVEQPKHGSADPKSE